MTHQKGQAQPAVQQQPAAHQQQASSQQQHDPQAIAAAAQLGQQIQRSGLDPSTFFKLIAIVQKHGDAFKVLGDLFTDLRGVFGGAAAPEGQSQAK